MKGLKITLTMLVVLATAAALVIERRAQMKLRAENLLLKQEIAQLSFARVEDKASITPAAEAEKNPAVGVEQARELLRLRGEVGRLRRQKAERERLQAENDQARSSLLTQALQGRHTLTREHIERYLEKTGRSAANLLTAFQLARDSTFLEEALAKFPMDPQVALAGAVARVQSPEQRRWRLEAFKQAAPDNALANYLSAQAYFKAGQSEEAVKELMAAAAKPNFQDYSQHGLAGLEDAYLAAGYPKAVAITAAWSSRDWNWNLNELIDLRQSLEEVAKRYQQAGNQASAQAVRQLGLDLGQRLVDQPLGLRTEHQELLGLLLQRRLLESMDSASQVSTGATVQDRLNELASWREEIKKLSDPDGWHNYLLKTLSEEDLIGYFDRVKTVGEIEARRWAWGRPGIR